MGPVRLPAPDTVTSQTLPIHSGTGSWEERSGGRPVSCSASLPSLGHQQGGRQSIAKHRIPLPSISGRHQTASTLCAEDVRLCSPAASSAVTKASAHSPGLLAAPESRRSGKSTWPGALCSSSAFIQHRVPLAPAPATSRRLAHRSRRAPPTTSAMAPGGEEEGIAARTSLEVDHSMMRRALELALSCKGMSCKPPFCSCCFLIHGSAPSISFSRT